jgi:Family of unknown function (DUF5995)
MVTVTLEAILRRPLPARVPEVVERLAAIEAALPAGDGVVYFTRLYRAVTEALDERARAGGEFADVRFVRWLDVVFANQYLRALRAHVLGRGRRPRAWAPLFEARTRRGIAPIQFALAGMNAHINADLPLALVSTCRARGVELVRGGPQHADFRRVDLLLDEVEGVVKGDLAVGLVGVAEEALGRLDDVLAMWKVRKAREAAWANAETLWALRGLPLVAGRYALTLDRTVGFAGRGLLVPVLD